MQPRQLNYSGTMLGSFMVFPAAYIVIEGHSSTVDSGVHYGIVLGLVLGSAAPTTLKLRDGREDE